MRTFTDSTGRTWTVAVNVDSIKRVRAMRDVDLLDVIDGKLVERFIQDPILLCDVVYVVCKPEADALGVSDEDFGRAMAGDAIEHATRALLEDAVSFSPSPRDRAALQRVLDTTWNLMDKTRDVIETRLDRELDRVAREVLARLTDSSGSSQESPASIRAP